MSVLPTPHTQHHRPGLLPPCVRPRLILNPEGLMSLYPRRIPHPASAHTRPHPTLIPTGLVSFLPASGHGDLWSVEGGNSRLAQALLNASGAVLHLGASVLQVQQDAAGRYSLQVLKPEEDVTGEGAGCRACTVARQWYCLRACRGKVRSARAKAAPPYPLQQGHIIMVR